MQNLYIEFLSALNQAIASNKISKRDLADKLEVAEFMIDHWVKGQAKPAKLMQEQILQYLQSLKQ